MDTPEKTIPAGSDVLQSDHHSHFTTEEIAKAVARHKREHPEASKKAGTELRKGASRKGSGSR